MTPATRQTATRADRRADVAAARLLSALVVALLVAACAGGTQVTSGGSEPTSTATTASPAGDDGDGDGDGDGEGAFPVTIPHRFGETTVPSRPVRVVSHGFNDQDTLLALGTTPVAIREWYGEFPDATWPWAQDDLGDAEITVLSSEEPDFEQIAAADPDLIAGIFSGMTESDYETLSAIAPTIASPAEYPDFGTPWREVVRIYGEALGAGDTADRIVTDLDARFAEVRDDHPAFDGAEAAVGFFASGDLGVYTSADLRSRLLADLGFTVPQEIDEAAGEGAFFAPLSLERADLVDRDVVVWVTATEEEIAELRSLDVLDTLQISREGRQIFTDFLLNGAFSFSSPLSIPYLLDELVPQLEAAVDGDPSTTIPEADPPS